MYPSTALSRRLLLSPPSSKPQMRVPPRPQHVLRARTHTERVVLATAEGKGVAAGGGRHRIGGEAILARANGAAAAQARDRLRLESLLLVAVSEPPVAPETKRVDGPARRQHKAVLAPRRDRNRPHRRQRAADLLGHEPAPLVAVAELPAHAPPEAEHAAARGEGQAVPCAGSDRLHQTPAVSRSDDKRWPPSGSAEMCSERSPPMRLGDSCRAVSPWPSLPLLPCPKE
mmetsp:Transcript_49381/g.160041  ORF Transcript_49381/g.160041 Transcript_49381/m.160041 type:complete len:229 (-) Transcript_49381:936-1622(-)